MCAGDKYVAAGDKRSKVGLGVARNPLENFEVLYPTGVDEIRDEKVFKTGGIEWTIKDGIPFHLPTVSAEIRDMVSKARKGQNRER
jgi:hypothetical protein